MNQTIWTWTKLESIPSKKGIPDQFADFLFLVSNWNAGPLLFEGWSSKSKILIQDHAFNLKTIQLLLGLLNLDF